MSVDRSCECGAIIPAYVLGCKACGRKYQVRDEFLIGQEILPEPPIEMWAQQLEDNKNQKKRGFIFGDTSARGNKRSLKDIASLMAFILLSIVVIFAASPSTFKDSIFQQIGIQEKFSLNFQEDVYGFKFLEYADNGVPAYFKGCGPIDYFVRQNYASSEDFSLIGEAMSVISQGLGRSFKFQGFTEVRDVSKLPEAVLIDFTSSSEFQEELRSSKFSQVDAAGLGGPDLYETTSKPRFGSLAAARGTLWINEEYWSDMERSYKVHLLTHELGHVLGLTHPTNGVGQVMSDLDQSYELSSLGSGDRMGLQILSALAGCRDFPDYLAASSEQNRAKDQDAGLSDESDVYNGEADSSGQTGTERSLISIGLNSCGNEFPKAVQKLNDRIPASWRMSEDDGCGSGRTYTWSDPDNSSEFVYLEFGASVGWCQDIEPEDLDEIRYYFFPEVNDFKRAYADSGRYIYVYTRSSADYSQNNFGIVEVGNEYQFCGDGHTILEVSERIRNDDQVFDGMISAVFGN